MTTQPALYRLKFMPEALDEWNRLDGSIKALLKKQLKNRLGNPHSPGNELRGDTLSPYIAEIPHDIVAVFLLRMKI
jgi:mRNA interferase RelE/StbE